MESLLSKNLGYNKPLYILPFDHRSYFEHLLNFEEPLNENQIKQITTYKKLIYKGYEASLSLGISKEESAILVDDTFGMEILTDAVSKGYTTLQSTEVSGDDHFEFDHGSDWKKFIEQVHPTFVKALVRYNPEGSSDLNQKSLKGLKELSDYAHANGYKFLIEPLVPGTETQLAQVENDKRRFDKELRPVLTARMIQEMQNAGVEPDVWKIEGMFSAEDYQLAVTTARQQGRDNVGIVSLGRNETDEVVATWLSIGASVDGVVGFAVGRTIFLNALEKFQSGEFTEDAAVEEIAKRFYYFYSIFTKK